MGRKCTRKKRLFDKRNDSKTSPEGLQEREDLPETDSDSEDSIDNYFNYIIEQWDQDYCSERKYEPVDYVEEELSTETAFQNNLKHIMLRYIHRTINDKRNYDDFHSKRHDNNADGSCDFNHGHGYCDEFHSRNNYNNATDSDRNRCDYNNFHN